MVTVTGGIVQSISCTATIFCSVVPAETPNSESGETWLEMAVNFGAEIPLSYCSDFLHAVNSYDVGPTALLPLRRQSYYGFLSPLEIHRPLPGLNPRNWGRIASTITTIPPRRAGNRTLYHQKNPLDTLALYVGISDLF
jgi:hypothetical protein